MDGASPARAPEIRTVGALEGLSLVTPLLGAHWQEVGKFKELTQVKPRLEQYQALDEQGAFLGLIAEAGSEVVGYSANFFVHNMHYADLYFCQNDVLYVTPGYRKGRLGLKLIEETVRIAKQRGAKLMLWHAKEDTALHALLPRLGYEVLDVIHAKRI
jgi:GNAT superfamily N-acetyltransferase